MTEPVAQHRVILEITERDDPDGARRLTLTGELDLSSAPKLRERLSELRATGRTVRLDLSQLDFMDSSGITLMLLARSDSAANGWKLEIDPDVSQQDERLIAMLGIERKLWPTQR